MAPPRCHHTKLNKFNKRDSLFVFNMHNSPSCRVHVGCQTNLEFWLEMDVCVDCHGEINVEEINGRVPINFHVASTMGTGPYMRLLQSPKDNFDIEIIQHDDSNVFDVSVTAKTNHAFWFQVQAHYDPTNKTVMVSHPDGKLPINSDLARFMGSKYLDLLQNPEENFTISISEP